MFEQRKGSIRNSSIRSITQSQYRQSITEQPESLRRTWTDGSQERSQPSSRGLMEELDHDREMELLRKQHEAANNVLGKNSFSSNEDEN